MTYKVQSGDTFSSISQKLHISVQALEAANPGVNANNLKVGEELNVPGGASSATTKYTIKSGDTLFSIAQSHGISVEAIEAANPGIKPSALKVGQVINIPAGHSGPIKPPPPSSGNGYVQYSGPASNFPDPKEWASYDKLWSENERLMKFHDSDSEIADIKKSIEQVSKESGVDSRVILCIIVQESGGNVRIPTVSTHLIRKSHSKTNPHARPTTVSAIQV